MYEELMRLPGCSLLLRPSQGFLWNKGIYFRETGEQRKNCEGNLGPKTILGSS